jgi:hypothetical protein
MEDRMAGGYLLKSGHQASAFLAKQKRREREAKDRLAPSGYANKSNYLNTAVASKDSQDRFKMEGAFQPIYAHITVDPNHGAGIGFQYDAAGWKVATIKPIPGQKEIELDDVILEIEGKSIVGKTTAEQAAIFKQFFRHNAVLKVQRNHYCNLTNNQEAVKRQYDIDGYGDKALRDYKNNPMFRKNRFMDESAGAEEHGTGVLDLKHSKMDTIRFVQRLPQSRPLISGRQKTWDEMNAMERKQVKDAQKQTEIAAKFKDDDGACWRPGD